MARYDDYDDRDPDDDRPMPRRRRDEYEDREEDEDEYDDYDDYDRPKRSSRRRAAEKVALPAIFLIILGSLGLLMAVGDAVARATGLVENPFANAQNKNDPAFKAGEKVGNALGPVIRLVWGAIVLAGGIHMKRLNSRALVMFSCIWAMLPCNECCLLGIPFGIWGIVAISDETVKRYM